MIKYQPNNAFAYFRRGFAHKALKLYEEAADDFLKARDLKPDDPRLIINKKQIYQTKYRKLCQAGEEEWSIFWVDFLLSRHFLKMNQNR